MQNIEAAIVMIIIAVSAILFSSDVYHSHKFADVVKAPCLEKCEAKWVVTDITADWKGSSCRCATVEPEKKLTPDGK